MAGSNSRCARSVILSRACAALAASLLLVQGVTPAVAQWTVGAGVRAPRFSGGSVESGTGNSLRPYRPTLVELSLHLDGRRVGLGLRAHYASSSLAFEGPEALAAIKDALTVYGLQPELSLRVGRLGPSSALRVFAGPLVEVWQLPDVGSHVRMGLAASVEIEVPFGARWMGSAGVGAAVSSSPFRREDLNVGLEPRALWRREALAGLKYRL